MRNDRVGGDIYISIDQLKKMGEPFILCTVISAEGSVPGKIGWKMVVSGEGRVSGTVGGGAVERYIIENSISMLRKGISQPEKKKIDLEAEFGMYCGGVMEFLLDPHHPEPRLVIFGGGHIGSVLSTLGKIAGFHVTVVDEREDYANKSMLPAVDIILNDPPLDIADKIPWGKDLYIVIVTHEHNLDEGILRMCLTREWTYLGMIGSRSKVEGIFQRLKNEGIDEKLISKVSSPIGIDIGAETPQEIAISIISEVINMRRRGGDEIRFMKEKR